METDFATIIARAGINPGEVKILRHTSGAGVDVYDAWKTRRAAFEVHQSIQQKARRSRFNRPFWASCVGLRDGRTVFLGFYRATMRGPVQSGLTCELSGHMPAPEEWDWYDCESVATLSEYSGKLLLGWRGQEWVQNGESHRMAQILDEAVTDLGKPRNPPWSRDELILALDLYMRHRPTLPGQTSKPVLEVSQLLNELAKLDGGGAGATFRNGNGVYMKLMNFRRLDPEVAASGQVGLTRGNKDEEVVWDTFANDVSYLSEVASAIRRQVLSEPQPYFRDYEEDGFVEASEGRVLTKLHRTRERSRKLVDRRKRQELARAGKLVCQVCDFDFAARYGERGNGFIEAHHTKPVHTLSNEGVTKLEDLALLCSNCHRMIHSSKRWLSIDELKGLLVGA